LLEGLAWDAAGHRYEDLAGLTAYAVRVAGSVGAMMSIVMGGRAPQVVARACDLGVAMQFTNIARDVGEDAREGRIYLPLQWLRDAGIAPDEWLSRPVFSPALGAVVQRLLDEADALYERSGAGIARLPLACRPGIHAARLIYSEIGLEIERQQCDSISQRAVVSPSRKVALLVRALGAMLMSGRSNVAATVEEARFLVDAVRDASLPRATVSEGSRGRLGERLTWVIDLFERLERRQQLGRS
jgi:phytoene synthase